jgi:oligopeptide transport system substrate-binding protein
MRMKRPLLGKKCSMILFGLLLGAVLSGPSFAASTPGNQKVFTFRLQGDPETLDWNRAHTSVETHILMNLMEGLISHDPKMNIVPALAEKWTKSPDGKLYTFKLRPGVKWSDGVPLKAQDFVYSWKRLLSPLTAASYAYLLFDIEGAEDFYHGKQPDFSKVGIKATSESTLEVRLARPVAHFIHIPTFWVTFPLRQDIVERYGNSWPKPGRMVTVGPFDLLSYDIDSKIVLRPNPHYYGERGNIDQAVGLIVKEDSTALTLYESGKLDFLTDISAVDLKRLEGKPDLKRFPYLKTGYLGIVVDKYPVSNVHLRKAISLAIDRRKFGQILFGGQTTAQGFIPPGMFGYNKSIGLPFDPVKAKKELALSGLDAASVKLEVVTTPWEKTVTICEYIQAELKKNLGIDLKIQTYDHKTFRAQLELRSFPLFLMSWSADFPDPDNFLSVFLGSSGNNRANWKNAQYDAKVLLGRVNQNPAARQKLYDDSQKLLVEQDVAIVPLFNEPITALVSSRTKNLEINPLNYLRIKKISLDDGNAKK